MKQIYNDLIYLVYCGINEKIPDKSRVARMDLDALYDTAKRSSICSVLYVPLEAVGAATDKFSQTYNKSVRKNILLDIERGHIIDYFEEHGIWYMPMKGCLLKEMYPAPGMREMSDNDLIIDPDRLAEMNKFMTERGYRCPRFAAGHCDQYNKPPVLNFEFHACLFSENTSEKMAGYYRNIKDILIKDEDNKFGYHFSDEEFYLYMTAHEYKHYSGSGTGIRSLIDSYIYTSKKGSTLDWKYVEEHAEALGIADFEKQRRKLAEKLFSQPELPAFSEEEKEMLEFYLGSGTYGNLEQAVKRDLNKNGHGAKAKYILRRFFPPLSFMKEWYPICRKSPLLIPVGYVWRWIKGITSNRRKLSTEINVIMNHKQAKKRR